MEHDREYWTRHARAWLASAMTQANYSRRHRPSRGTPGYRASSLRRCDLQPQRRDDLYLGETVVEKWLITAEPRSRIPLNLYRPRNTAGRIPAPVLTSGHGDSRSVAHMGCVARTCAHAGVACLLADPLGEEERHREERPGTRTYYEQDAAYRSEIAERPVMGKLVLDAMRGPDFLETPDWVDAGRVAVAGNSFGGEVAGWLFALEPHLRAARSRAGASPTSPLLYPPANTARACPATSCAPFAAGLVFCASGPSTPPSSC